jgi:hypothetical protein
VKSYVARRKIAALPTKHLRDYHAARESLRNSSENLLALEEALALHISGWSRADTLTLVDAEPPVHSPFDLSTDKFAYVDLLVRSHGSPLNNRVTGMGVYDGDRLCLEYSESWMKGYAHCLLTVPDHCLFTVCTYLFAVYCLSTAFSMLTVHPTIQDQKTLDTFAQARATPWTLTDIDFIHAFADYATPKLAALSAQLRSIAVDIRTTQIDMRKHTLAKKVRNKLRGALRTLASKIRPVATVFNAVLHVNTSVGGDLIQLPGGSFAQPLPYDTLNLEALLGDVAWNGDYLLLPGDVTVAVLKMHLQPRLAYLVNLARRSFEQVGICQNDSRIGSAVYTGRRAALTKLLGKHLSNPASGWAHHISVARTEATAILELYNDTTTELVDDLLKAPMPDRMVLWHLAPSSPST